MKRLWVSAALILAMAGLAACHVLYLHHFTGDLNDLLHAAQEQVDQGDWDEASALTQQAMEQWERHSFYVHTTLRHEDIDAISVAFQETLAFLNGQEQQSAEYAASNVKLLTLLSLLLEGEHPSLQNLL
jgi:hypothetical protein